MLRLASMHPCRPTAPIGAPRRGFTLIELLTVIGIIAILAAILIPTIQTVQINARRVKSASNLSSIGKAFMLYAQDNHGLLPAPKIGENTGTAASAVGSPNPKGASWLVELVTYLDGSLQQNSGGGSSVIVTKWPEVLSCPQFISINNGIENPEIRGYGMTIYPFRADRNNPNRNTGYPSQRQSMVNLPNPANNVIVGTSNAVTLEPALDGSFPQSEGRYSNGDPVRFHGVGLFLMLEGSVQALSPEEAAKVMAVPER